MNGNPIIVLNGASSAGKTTLCKELQALLSSRFIHLEEDRFVYGTVHPRFLQPGVVDDTFSRTMLGFYRSLAAFASAGFGVLADTGLYSPSLIKTCAAELAGQRAWLIGVRCSLEELERRERGRSDRTAGMARSQYESVHAGVVYDLEVDTSRQTLAECALSIKSLVETDASPTAMQSLRDRA